MATFEPLVSPKLSIQRALLGEVTERLVGVTCGLRERHIRIRAYVSGAVTEDDIARIQFVGNNAKIIVDYARGVGSGRRSGCPRGFVLGDVHILRA